MHTLDELSVNYSCFSIITPSHNHSLAHLLSSYWYYNSVDQTLPCFDHSYRSYVLYFGSTIRRRFNILWKLSFFIRHTYGVIYDWHPKLFYKDQNEHVQSDRLREYIPWFLQIHENNSRSLGMDHSIKQKYLI